MSGINFSFPPPPVPDLQAVTDVGAATNNTIQANVIRLGDTLELVGNSSKLTFFSNESNPLILKGVSAGWSSQEILLPDASGTVNLGSGGIGNLQQVLNVGNTADTDIQLNANIIANVANVNSVVSAGDVNAGGAVVGGSGQFGSITVGGAAVLTGDTGWVDISSSIDSTNWQAIGDNFSYRIIAGVIYYQGVLICITTATNVIGTFPAALLNRASISAPIGSFTIPAVFSTAWVRITSTGTATTLTVYNSVTAFQRYDMSTFPPYVVNG